jgi:hypothetical protein
MTCGESQPGSSLIGMLVKVRSDIILYTIHQIPDAFGGYVGWKPFATFEPSEAGFRII